MLEKENMMKAYAYKKGTTLRSENEQNLNF